MNDHTPTTVGIDVCKAHLDVHEPPSGRSGRFANDAAGFVELADWIPPDVARVVYESTGPWHRALEEALAENLPLARVNALRARRFSQAVGQQAKTDAVDARMLAAMGAAVQTRLVELPSATQRDLDELQTARDALAKSRIAVLNRRHIARHPLVKRQLRYRLTQIDNQLKAIAAAIRKLVKADEALARKTAVLTSIPGVAATTAAGLLAGMPELGRLDAKAVSSLAGLAPVARESGQWKGRRFIGGGRGRVRKLLYMAALSAVQHNPDLAGVYTRLRERGKPGKVALTAVMRKLIVLANTLLKEDREWTPAFTPSAET